MVDTQHDSQPLWYMGSTRSGKTTHLVQAFRQSRQQQHQQGTTFVPSTLVLAANDDNRRDLTQRFMVAVQGRYPIVSKTPLGLIAEEVILFWPLIFEQLHLKAQFPLRLRPETEQELATKLWRSHLDNLDIPAGHSEWRLVRRALDLLQLAGASCTPTEDIPHILALGLSGQGWENDPDLWHGMGKKLLEWRQWCLERGFLTYGIIYELYWRHLLPHKTYQYHLTRRYREVFGDDLDDYPAIARSLLTTLLDSGATGAFTYNPDGQVRLMLNADPEAMLTLCQRCQIQYLAPTPPQPSTPRFYQAEIVQTAVAIGYIPTLPACIQSLQTTSRATLLRQTADLIVEAVNNQQIAPQDIAIIAPGLDPIARYTLIEILSHQGIPIEPLNEQRPLISSAVARSLLTLLTLIYPGLQSFSPPEAVAEMLVMLSCRSQSQRRLDPIIDPVRAGLLADYCYQTHKTGSRLLPVETFDRWDRLGSQVTQMYNRIRDWIAKNQLIAANQPKPSYFFDRAIQDFLDNGNFLPFEQLSALRELMETAQHFWEVERRSRQHETSPRTAVQAIAEFIQLLRTGTITANAYPSRFLSLGETQSQGAITLATVFQYRSARRSHRWHFWLDASSFLWERGGAATLFGAPLFLKNWSGGLRLPEHEEQENQARLERILKDLSARAKERIYLCHSDLAVTGSEQTGVLLSLVYAAPEYQPLT
ncbi:MAG: recombinase family protein [Jaaginema sp. PMC 1079.18]|nr:recombinase family protein [Jaaginema sp. PMC 1080.18]MEC4850953.1 recombinase family protein [Jaaginema sp. PMC 1079.18]